MSTSPERYAPYAHRPVPRVPRTRESWAWRGCDVAIERIGRPDAPVRVLVVHGAGGNADALAPFAAHLAALGAAVTVPDLPGYGRTRTPDDGKVRYGDWRALLADLVRHEHDARPLVVLGASVGGMLAYDVAASTGLAEAVVATCLLDPREAVVRDRLTWHPWLGRLGGPVLRRVAGPLADLRVPIRWIADMRHIANDPGLVREVLTDRRGGGGRVPLGWMRSYLDAEPVVEPELFTTRVLVAQPADDRWTPYAASAPFVARLAGVTEVVMLEGCGHFPVELPGFDMLLAAVARLLADVAEARPA